MGVDTRELGKTLVYTQSAPVTSLVADIGAIRELDAATASVQARFGWLTALAIVTIVIGLIGLAVTGGSPAFLGLSGAAFLASLVCGVLWRRAANRNAENRRYDLLDRVLRLLEPDLGDQPVSIKLDLRPADHGSKFTNKGQVGPWQVKYFEDPWLELEGRFLDKTAFKLVATERHQQRVKHYRSASGKSKSKSKSKSSHQLVLRLKPKPTRYGHLQTIGAKARGAVRLPRYATLKDLTVTDGEALLKVASSADWAATPPDEPDTAPSGTEIVAMMFLSLYQVLNLSREVTRRAA